MTKHNKKNRDTSPFFGKIKRRSFLKGAAATAAVAAVGPHIWSPNSAIAQTAGRNTIKHVVYIRLSGGFRFPTAFNADVASEFNPFGSASNRAEGTEWGVGQLLERSDWLNDDLRQAGLQPTNELTNQFGVLPCVDHEPFAARADGNHGTGLERYLTGYVGGQTGLFTMINYSLRNATATERAPWLLDEFNDDNVPLLPAFVFGVPGMGRGGADFAKYRPPIMDGSSGFDSFGFDLDSNLPEWAVTMTNNTDRRMRDRQHSGLRGNVDAYIQTRESASRYNTIFRADALKIRNDSDDLFDGISNARLETLFGDSRAARTARLALRLFHFGCPAVYFDQGGYDYHSGEEDGLPRRWMEVNRLISAFVVALKEMQYPTGDGSTYWDHTVITFGSEFGRTARGNRFNSARGSDHSGDYATRWMSMPFIGGPVSGIAGKMIGQTRASDLEPVDKVFSYRSMFKTLLDGLGGDHEEFFPADKPFDELFTG